MCYFGNGGLYKVWGKTRVKGRVGRECYQRSKFAKMRWGLGLEGWVKWLRRVWWGYESECQSLDESWMGRIKKGTRIFLKDKASYLNGMV